MDSYNMDKFQNKYAERKKPDTNKTTLFYFIYAKSVQLKRI